MVIMLYGQTRAIRQTHDKLTMDPPPTPAKARATINLSVSLDSEARPTMSCSEPPHRVRRKSITSGYSHTAPACDR